MESLSHKNLINENNSQPILEEISPGCFFYKEPINVNYIDQNIINKLLVSLTSSNLKLGRICLHQSHEDIIQSMIIALHQDYLVNCHVHNGPEILKIIQGQLLITERFDNGKTKEHLLSSQDLLLLRLTEGVVHSVKSLSGWAVFLEIGNGPFDQNKTIYV